VIREVLDRFTGSNDDAVDESEPVYDGVSQDLDTVYEVLKNERRRWLLQYLEAANSPVSFRELAKQRASIENDCDIEELSSQKHKRVYIGLYQCHVPKLEDAGLVVEEGGMITPTEDVPVLVAGHGMVDDLVNGGDA
jgi:hypothetical protein